MTLTTDVAGFIRLCNVLRSKGIDGSFDELFLEQFRLKRIRKWGPFAKFMRYTYYRPFAKRRIVEGIRLDVFEIKEALFNYHVRTGDQDCKNAIDLIQQYLDSLPKRKEKKWEIKDYLLIVAIPSILSIASMALNQNIDWIYLWLAVGVFILFIPLLGAFATNRLFTHLTEWWWYRYWKRKLGIDPLKARIINKTMESPLTH